MQPDGLDASFAVEVSHLQWESSRDATERRVGDRRNIEGIHAAIAVRTGADQRYLVARIETFDDALGSRGVYRRDGPVAVEIPDHQVLEAALGHPDADASERLGARSFGRIRGVARASIAVFSEGLEKKFSPL